MEKFVWPNMRRHYIREHLDARGKNQEWLSGQLNRKPGTISRWINDPGRVDMHVLSAVADVLGMKRAGDLLEPPRGQSARAVLEEALEALPPEPPVNSRGKR